MLWNLKILVKLYVQSGSTNLIFSLELEVSITYEKILCGNNAHHCF
jgi:hypothetical protein